MIDKGIKKYLKMRNKTKKNPAEAGLVNYCAQQG